MIQILDVVESFIDRLGGMMISSKVWIFGTVLSLGVMAPALAQSPPDKSALQDNCAGDYLRLCGQFSPDGPEVEQCFKDRAKELSPECSAAIAAYTKKNPRGRRR